MAFGITESGEEEIGGLMELHQGVISKNTIGANIQADDDLVFRSVLWLNNRHNIDTVNGFIPGMQNLPDTTQ